MRDKYGTEKPEQVEVKFAEGALDGIRLFLTFIAFELIFVIVLLRDVLKRLR